MYLIRNGAGHRWLAEKKDKEEFQHIVLCNWKPRNVTSEYVSWFNQGILIFIILISGAVYKSVNYLRPVYTEHLVGTELLCNGTFIQSCV